MTLYSAEDDVTERNTWILGIVIASIAVVVLGVGIYFFVSGDKNEFDPVTGCPIVDGQISPHSQMVVIVDETDTLTPIQSDSLKVALKNLVNNELTEGSLLSIYTITEDFSTSRKPVFEACKIRDGSHANQFTENERKLKRRFETFFKAPLSNLISQITEKNEPAKSSPIMEVVQSVSVNSMQKWATPETRLIIFSDMLHHTPGFSLYQTKPSFAAFKGTAYAAQVKTMLNGASVDLYYFVNNPKFQGQNNVTFWRDYFRSTGAKVESVIPLGQ